MLYLYLIQLLVVSEQVRIYSHCLCHECGEQAGCSASSEDDHPPLYLRIHNSNPRLFLDHTASFITQMTLFTFLIC